MHVSKRMKAGDIVRTIVLSADLSILVAPLNALGTLAGEAPAPVD